MNNIPLRQLLARPSSITMGPTANSINPISSLPAVVINGSSRIAVPSYFHSSTWLLVTNMVNAGKVEHGGVWGGARIRGSNYNFILCKFAKYLIRL